MTTNETTNIRFEDWGTGYYIITPAKDRGVLGRMFHTDSGWYFTDDPRDEHPTYQFAATRFNDAKRIIREHFCRIAVAALALVAIPTFAHPVYPPDDYLAGCTITHYEDGSRYAECPEDGAVLVWDQDGQRFVNDAGAPIHGAGWYVIE